MQPREENKAQPGTKVRAQLEKGLRLSLGQARVWFGPLEAWHVEDSRVASLLVVPVFIRGEPVLLGIQACSPWGWVGAGSLTLGRLEGRAERVPPPRAAILGLSKSRRGS